MPASRGTRRRFRLHFDAVRARWIEGRASTPGSKCIPKPVRAVKRPPRLYNRMLGFHCMRVCRDQTRAKNDAVAPQPARPSSFV